MEKLVRYFEAGITSKTLETIGMEVETQFVGRGGDAISVATSQQILGRLAAGGWQVASRKGDLITALADPRGNAIFYELGRHNIELSTATATTSRVVGVATECLDQIYAAGRLFGAYPYFAPVLQGDEDLLVVPDERDAVWLQLDGRSALAPLARTSSVQFTISVSPKDAVRILNNLGRHIGVFMADYPQEEVWRRYIAESRAGYRPDRFGGPLVFDDVRDYCAQLARHDVVSGARLQLFAEVPDLDIPLFIRSVWWYFRLKRYGNALCIEVRPLARRGDDQFERQLGEVLSIIAV